MIDSKRINFRGFTLIELLVVISIIAILMSITMPSLQKAREAAKQKVCLTNQRTIAIAMTTYSADNKGKLFLRYDKNDASVSWKNAVPYSWPNFGCVDLMGPYIGLLDAVNCPTSKFKSEFIEANSNTHYGDWIVNLLWLPGLSEHGRGKFFEKTPSVASLNLTRSSSNKFLITDRNNYHVGQSWGWSNHAAGEVKVGTVRDFVKSLKGGNRIYVDCHGEWAKPEEMGNSGNAPTDISSGSRYSHSGDDARPYYW